MAHSQDDLVGSAEAARLIERSQRTIHRLVDSGALVPVLTAPGGRHGAFVFRRSDVLKHAPKSPGLVALMVEEIDG